MELIAVLLMLAAGAAVAFVVMVAYAIAQREGGGRGEAIRAYASDRDAVAASLLFHVLSVGGASDEEALRRIRREAGLLAPVTSGIDIGSWSETYARATQPEQRAQLLEMAVALVAARSGAVPLRQYAALLDLSFGLGFQTDALARLRSRYGFEYVDHAKQGRPRSADRGGGGTPLFDRGGRPRSASLEVLGIRAEASRQEVVAAYRRLVARHHPDRFHNAPAAERDAAAARFVEITRAYEELLGGDRD